VSCYTTDGVFMPTTFPTAVGADLAKAYDQVFSAIHLAVTFTIDELVVTSDTSAFALTRSNGSVTVHATGDSSTESNRELFIFTLEDGAWKFSRYMFNKAE
jgi:ketosteroid isomerase-like protein